MDAQENETMTRVGPGTPAGETPGAIGYLYFFRTRSTRNNQKLSAASRKTCYCSGTNSAGSA